MERFRFALGTRVRVGGSRAIRSIVARYMRQPIFEGGRARDVYWLDRPIQELKYFSGDDLTRVKQS